MKIAVASDHAAHREKAALASRLRAWGHEVVDLGTHSGDASVDYPDFARPAAEAVSRGEAERAILLCGSGVGPCMVANRVRGVRAVLAAHPFVAEMSRRHQNANVACFGARWQDLATIESLTKLWLETPFDGGRHEGRVAKIHAVER